MVPPLFLGKLIQDQYTTASFSCPFSKREHSPGEEPPRHDDLSG
jgi:hypothetical protein